MLKKIANIICCNDKSIINRLIIAKIFRLSVNVLWVIIGIVALYISFIETKHIIYYIIYEKIDSQNILHEIVTVFIYLEIVTMIIKYFEENYHFPLRYVIYIAITALARHIIGDMQHAYEYSIAILVLIIAYGIIRIVSHIVREKDELPRYERKP